MKPSFIPLATSQSGSCLTMANWQELGIQTLAYSLHSLLMKPGYSLLNSLPNLQSYCGWPGSIVLTATLAAANTLGIYTFRSLYDGSLISISQEELFSLIIKLQPDLVILPAGFRAYLVEQQLSLPSSIKLFVPVDESLEAENTANLGVNLVYEMNYSFSDLLSQVKQYKARPLYLSGAFNYSEAQELIEHGADWLESDKPASDAFHGQVYGDKDSFSLLNKEMTNQHVPISSNCGCPTCRQKLTRAYLHHLITHTPLLCQRFLIHHNVHYYNHRIETSSLVL
ncbi:MAG: tRNA-guanine transglycosylase [Tatlockia sp.]|nr:tRNA-guanine transglycosylase [Tatlockia sp.]